MGLLQTASQVPTTLFSYPDTMSALVFESYWQNKAACEDAERAYYQKLSGCKVDSLSSGLSASEEMALMKKLNALELENKGLKKVTDDLKALVLSLQARVDTLWGATKLVPVGYGIQKLQIMCTVEDEKVSIEELGEKMEAFEDFVQSVDVAAMNKI